MHHTSRTRLKLRLINATFVVLFLIATGLLHWLSRQYTLSFDLTRTGQHSLTEASIKAAERLPGTLEVVAYASKANNTRAQIRDLVTRYQRHKHDIALRFVDPDESPNEVRAAGILNEGEMVLHYHGTSDHLSPRRLSEEEFTNALVRLGHRGERWIVFLAGHGERSPDRNANFDLSSWTADLQKRGFKTRELSLAESGQIPANTAILVIAGPRVSLLAGEVKTIQKYLDNGGNLLWLADPGSLHGLQPLAETLGAELLPGVVVDPSAEKITGNAAAIVIGSYGSHPVVRDFPNATLFPQTGALSAVAVKDWHGEAILDTPESAWLETGKLDKAVEFNAGRDKRGPLTIAMAFTRTLDKREQRVALIANGDFLSNRFVTNLGNLDLGLSLVNWLSRDDAYVSIPVRAARDRRLDLSYVAQAGFAIVFLIGLPLTFIVTGIVVWWRRRKR